MTPAELRERMDGMGFNVKKTARALGVTQSAVYHWLGGTRSIPGPLDLALTSLETGSVVEAGKLRVPPHALKSMMEHLGLNVKALARRLGVTPQAVYYWLAGTHPTPPMLYHSLRALMMRRSR